jgi:hypothetical protein
VRLKCGPGAALPLKQPQFTHFLPAFPLLGYLGNTFFLFFSGSLSKCFLKAPEICPVYPTSGIILLQAEHVKSKI